MENDIARNTRKVFENINFDELSEGWINSVIESEFTDTTDNPISLGILFTGDPGKILSKVDSVCDAWAQIAALNDADETNASLLQEETLWTCLEEMEITSKQILGVIYLLCSKACKSSSSLEEKKIGLWTAKVYLKLMRFRGCTVYYSNLFRKCIECLHVPSHVESKNSGFKWKDYEGVLPLYVMVLETLLPLLGAFHLGSDDTTVGFVIEKLSKLAATELAKNKLNFELDFLSMSKHDRSRYSLSTVVTSLAYQGFSILMDHNMNGEKEDIYSDILLQLEQHILCKKHGKGQNITVKFHAIKDNAVAFICHNLQDKDQLCSQLTLESLKRLCVSVNNTAEFRSAVSQAVVTIMFKLRVEDIAHLLKWLLCLVDANQVSYRVFGLEILGLLLGDTPVVDTEGLPEEMEVYLTPIPLVFAILTRCDDVSPGVRTKALSLTSNHMYHVLSVLAERQEPEIFSGEVFEVEYDADFNGIHRSYWYRFNCFDDILKEIADIFHRRAEDSNSITRKAALQAIENIINFSVDYLSKDNLDQFTTSSKDSMIVMRKQTVQSLTNILNQYPSAPLSQEYWLRCAFPLVRDPEDSVQAKILSVIEEKFLRGVLSTSDVERDAALSLLRKMASGEFLPFQRYLQKAFGLWQRDKKLSPQMATQLERTLGGANDDVVWLYLSIFASFSKIPSKMCKRAVEEFEKLMNDENFTYVANILKFIGCVVSHLDEDMLESIRSILMQKLESYSAPVELLPIMIKILGKIEKILNRTHEFSEFSTKRIQFASDILSPFVSTSDTNETQPEDFAIKSFILLKEFCHIFPTNITPKLAMLLKQFVFLNENGEAAGSHKYVNPTLEAHAFAAIGKIGLQEESITEEILPLLARELLNSRDIRLRNNAVIILIEMCKRYTSYADEYIPLICTCFKDDEFAIRYQTITLMAGLLQEDYIKCKGPLFFCLLSTIIDEREEIQELGRFCLLQLLHAKNKAVFYGHFVDGLFVLNGFSPPEGTARGTHELRTTVRQLERFVVPDDGQRMEIYRFMLSFMDIALKAGVVQRLCEDVLEAVAGSVFPIEPATEAMVRDCFGILTSTEIRAYDAAKAKEEVEEHEEEEVVDAETKIRMFTLIRPVIPVLVQMKKVIWQSHTSLLGRMVRFLYEIIRDYKGDLEELLGEDRDLLKQVQYEQTNEKLMERAKPKSAALKRKHDNLRASHAPTPKAARGDASTRRPESDKQNGCDVGASTSRAIYSNGDVASTSRAIYSNGDVPSTSRAIYSNGDVASTSKRMDCDELMDVAIANDPLLCSTPRVVLRPLSEADLPNVSRISPMEVDVDSD